MKIIVADDHPFTLLGTKNFVESYGYKVIETCSNGISALNMIKLHQPEIAILDINMPGLDGLDVLQKISENKLKTKVILLTMHKETSIYKKAMQYNVYGFILKEHAESELESCLNDVSKGIRYSSKFLEYDLFKDSSDEQTGFDKLTVSERKIIEQIALQKTTKQIAELLFLSEKTVEGHRTNIITKLGLPKEKNILLKWAIRNMK